MEGWGFQPHSYDASASVIFIQRPTITPRLTHAWIQPAFLKYYLRLFITFEFPCDFNPSTITASNSCRSPPLPPNPSYTARLYVNPQVPPPHVLLRSADQRALSAPTPLNAHSPKHLSFNTSRIRYGLQSRCEP